MSPDGLETIMVYWLYGLDSFSRLIADWSRSVGAWLTALMPENLFDGHFSSLAFLVVLLYALFWALSRWHNIAVPSRKLLEAQIAGLQARLRTEQANGDDTKLQELAGKLKKTVRKLKQRGWGSGFLFWSRGRELASWKMVHDLERQLVEVYSPERVKAYLVAAEADLREIGGKDAVALADVIGGFNLFSEPDPLPNPQLTEIYSLLCANLKKPPPHKILIATDRPAELRALLQEALRIIYSYSDNEYAKLVTWHNKVAWLMVVSLAGIFFILTFHIGSAWLLGVGAVGGIVSRLTRSIRKRKPVPTDYGAYWTSFYLAPVFGALAAWAGILLIAGLVELNLLTGPFERVQWGNISYQNGVFSYVSALEPEDSSGNTLAEEASNPLAIGFQTQFYLATGAGNSAVQGLEQADTETRQDEQPNEDVLLTLALGLLLGFSERRLTQLTDKLDGAFEQRAEEA